MIVKTENPGIPCGLLRRLAIIVYDAAVVVSLLIAATMLAMLAGFGGRTALKDPVYTFFLFTIWFLYLGWCWHKGGMTVGMRAWRVMVVDEGGSKPGWGRSILRFLVSLLSAAAAGAGFLWALGNPGRRTWHDILSGTRLVRF